MAKMSTYRTSNEKVNLPDDNLPNPMSCSLTDTPRQMLSEVELARVDARCGSEMK
jgi:hypothetical protein